MMENNGEVGASGDKDAPLYSANGIAHTNGTVSGNEHMQLIDEPQGCVRPGAPVEQGGSGARERQEISHPPEKLPKGRRYIGGPELRYRSTGLYDESSDDDLYYTEAPKHSNNIPEHAGNCYYQYARSHNNVGSHIGETRYTDHHNRYLHCDRPVPPTHYMNRVSDDVYHDQQMPTRFNDYRMGYEQGDNVNISRDLKVNLFDGKQDWSAYWAQFQMIARYAGWSQRLQAIHLVKSLVGGARTILADMTSSQMEDLPRLVAALERRYMPREKVPAYRALFNGRRQQLKESVQDYAEELRLLAMRAFPVESVESREMRLVDKFVEGLQDSDLKKHVLPWRQLSLLLLNGRPLRRPKGSLV